MANQDFVFAPLSVPELDFYKYNLTIVGRRGAGKTSLALELFKGHCCLFDFEEGSKKAKGVPKIVPKNWKQFKSELDRWSKGMKKGAKPPFDTIILDSATAVIDMVSAHVLSENDWDDFNQGTDKVNRWSVLKKEFNDTMNGWRNLGFSIVWVCHPKDKVFKSRVQEDYNMYSADVGTTFDYQILGAADNVFFLDLARVEDSEGKKRWARKLILQNNIDYDVKCRFDALPDYILYDGPKNGVKKLLDSWDEAARIEYGDVEEQYDDTPFVEVDDEPSKPPKGESANPAPEVNKYNLEDAREKGIEVRDTIRDTLGWSAKETKDFLLGVFDGEYKIKEIENVDKLNKFIATYEPVMNDESALQKMM